MSKAAALESGTSVQFTKSFSVNFFFYFLFFLHHHHFYLLLCLFYSFLFALSSTFLLSFFPSFSFFSFFLPLFCLPWYEVTMPDDMARPLIRDAGGRGGRSRSLEASVSDPADPLVGILGTGDFSRSLAQRLLAAGYQVVVGSRTPKRFVALFPEEAEVWNTHTHNDRRLAFTPGGIIGVSILPSMIIMHSLWWPLIVVVVGLWRRLAENCCQRLGERARRRRLFAVVSLTFFYCCCQPELWANIKERKSDV